MDSARPPVICTGLFSLAADEELQWEKFREGIDIHRLYSNAQGPSAALLRYAPGASLPRHEHAGYEHILILRGSQEDDSGHHETGTLLIHPPGTAHAITSTAGCIVLAVWEKPVRFL
ncbi:MAG: anti-ECFsigma factor, ChrR [Phycisphaerales bacterium]|nr:anti-ECFsigma factor, ChrR [Phycisphaerales bacterium]